MNMDTLENLNVKVGDKVTFVNPVSHVHTDYTIAKYKCLTFSDGFVLDYSDSWATNPNFKIKENTMKAKELKVGDKFTWNPSNKDYGVFTVSKDIIGTAWGDCVTASSPQYGSGLFGPEEVTLVSTTVPRTLKELDAQVGDIVAHNDWGEYEVRPDKQLKDLSCDTTETYWYWDDAEYFNLVSRPTEETTTLTKPRIEVGKTYKSQNGNEWECIFIEGTVAYLRQSSLEALAYTWNVDGTAIWFKDYSDNIKFEPVICEGVDTISSGVVHVGNDKVSINGTVTTVDGVPDWTTYVEGS